MLLAFLCTLAVSVPIPVEGALDARPEASCDDESPGGLYELASRAISRREIDGAIVPLQALIHNHGSLPLTEIAAFHLAECYLLRERRVDALELLAVWLPRIMASESAEPFAPGVKAASNSLFQRAMLQLPDDPSSQEILASLLESTKDLPPDLKMRIAAELSRRFELSKDFPAAQKWLRRAVEASGEEATGELRDRMRFGLPLARAEYELSLGRANDCIRVLEEVDQSALSVSQQAAMRFLLAEAFLAGGRTELAERELAWLTGCSKAGEAPPVWHASVMLRRAEILVAARKYSDAAQLLKIAKAEYPDFEYAFEFEYLLARCAIASIEFESAKEHLQHVIESPGATGKEAVARATWMLGEVHFLQKQYSQAVEIYSRVVSMEDFPQWQARALFQTAKCHELQGHAPEAIEAYARAVEKSDDPHVNRDAAARMAAIRFALNDLR